MTKTITENKEALTESFGLFRGAKKETLAPSNEVPYHPGAVKYFEEAGIGVGGWLGLQPGLQIQAQRARLTGIAITQTYRG